jgi:tRNA G18 (ribose-2'-O)-methylase SpoU
MPRIALASADDPRLASYRDLPQQNLTCQSGLFIAEGEKVVERLAASDFEVHSILAEPEFAAKYESRLPAQTPIYVTSRDVLMKTIGFHFHRGILACGRRKPARSLSEILENDRPHEKLVVCPDVQDPTNLGSIIRSTAAFGCDGIVLGPKCADPFSRRVLRVSMGAALHLPIIESLDLATDLQQLAKGDFELIAAVLDSAAEPLTAARRSVRMALLLGSEGHGLGDEWLQLAHRRVTIPMQLGIDSLNVAVAAAVLLYHFCGSAAAHE